MKEPRKYSNDGYIKMSIVMTKIMGIICLFGMLGLWLFMMDIPIHWRFIMSIMVFIFSMKIAILSIATTAIIAWLLKLKKCFWHRMMVGIIYGMTGSGIFTFFAYKEWDKTEVISGVVVIFPICIIIGFISARVLPDKYREE